MNCEFSRLELKDILSNILESEVDPDVLAKLKHYAYGGVHEAPTIPPARVLQSIPEEFKPMVWTAALGGEGCTRKEHALYLQNPTHPEACKDHWTPQEVENDNALRVGVVKLQKQLAQRKPVYGPENASNINADFAEPDHSPPPLFKERPEIGSKNSLGHECVKYLDERPVYRCDQGHGYMPNNVVPGCPQCLMPTIGRGGGRGIDPGDKGDPLAIAGEDSRW